MVALAVGCSATPSLSVDDYADAAGGATEAYVAESQQLSLTYQKKVEREVAAIVEAGADNAVDEATALVRTETVMYLALLDDAISRYVAAMDALVAPDTVAEAHASYIVVVEAVHVTLPGMRDAVAAAESIPEIQAALVGSGFSDGQAAWVATCGALEQSVRNAGRGVDLKCVKRDVIAGNGGTP
jgi:hypothetical protein